MPSPKCCPKFPRIDARIMDAPLDKSRLKISRGADRALDSEETTERRTLSIRYDKGMRPRVCIRVITGDVIRK
jgi:hypothetical protein